MDVGVVIGALGLVLTVAGFWFTRRHRAKDRRDRATAVATRLVRECEGRRVLWNPFAWEEPVRTYDSVQALRQALRTARGDLPPNADGIHELDRMKMAAERFCDDYELDPPPSLASLRQMVESLRSDFVPALESVMSIYHIPAGRRPTSVNPFIGEVLREIYVEPPADDA